MRLIITRPLEDAIVTIEHLFARGHDGITAPLIAIEPCADVVLPARLWQAVLVQVPMGYGHCLL